MLRRSTTNANFFGSQKLASGSPHVAKFNMAAAVAGSQLFCPFRALGFVANHVPLTLQTQGTETLVTTAVGSAFHVYNVGQFCVVSWMNSDLA